MPDETDNNSKLDEEIERLLNEAQAQAEYEARYLQQRRSLADDKQPQA